MTHQSELIFQKVRNVLNTPRNVRRILFTVRAPSVTRINLAVLKVLLSERNERGIYLTVDRPDKYVLEILEKQNLASRAEISSLPEPPPRRIVVAPGVFSPAVYLDEIFLRLSDPRTRPGLDNELCTMSFLILDNLSTLTAFNGPKGIAACFEKMFLFLNTYPSIRLVAVAARDTLSALRPEAHGFFEMAVDLPDDWFIG
jgi:hypothetical protein